MRAIIQRVKHASVTIDNKITGKINDGFLVLLGITSTDTDKEVQWLAKKIVDLRVFNDSDDKMNLGLKDINGELLIISQFTLYGNCIKGRRPSFTEAAKPEMANTLYENFIDACKKQEVHVETGVFGADMKVDLLNDGPVTLIIDTNDLKK